MNRESVYFSHDADAMNDPKSMLLIAQLGMEGYGTFWALVEMLRTQPEYRLPLALIPAISARLNMTQAKLETVIRSFGLFDLSEDSFFFSQSLRQRMALMEEKSMRRRLAGKKGGEAKARKMLMITNPENEQINSNAVAMLQQCQSNAVALPSKEKKGNIITDVIIKETDTIVSGKKETEKTWKNDFETYLTLVEEAYTSLRNDQEEIKRQERFYKDVDIRLSLEKAYINFWATEAGWKHKKKSRSKDINMRSTLINAIPMNRVFYSPTKTTNHEVKDSTTW